MPKQDGKWSLLPYDVEEVISLQSAKQKILGPLKKPESAPGRRELISIPSKKCSATELIFARKRRNFKLVSPIEAARRGIRQNAHL